MIFYLNTIAFRSVNEKAELIPHLFRTEYSKIVAVLCTTFGLSNMEYAEDVVSETFLKASETWGLKGIPEHPRAWLYTVAKNVVKDHFKREKIFNEKVAPALRSASTIEELTELDLSDENLNDSMLKMMFAVCHQSISPESQIILALRVLCGFSIDEIANALLSNKAKINKRLVRAKVKLRDIGFEPGHSSKIELEKRMCRVLSILYLLFNEGYFSTIRAEKIRKDLCFEAMRLLFILAQNKETNIPQVNALMSLFCFQTSRFDARINPQGEQILYDDQNAEKWNKELIEKGEYYLGLSVKESAISKYHLEAMIAYWHTRKNVKEHEKWENILQLYNRLLQINYSPIAALNRTYALAMVKGKDVALKEALKIKLEQSPLYHSLLAELYKDSNIDKQIAHLNIALQVTQSENDKMVLINKLKEASR